MTEILEAGRELDALVAEKVMGWHYQKSKHGHWKVYAPDGTLHEPMYGAAKFDSQTGEPIVDDWSCGIDLPAYSEIMGDAWLVVERLKSLTRINGFSCDLCIKVTLGDRAFCDIFDLSAMGYTDNGPLINVAAEAATPALAICIAALQAVNPTRP